MARRRFGRVRRLPSGRWQARYRGPDGIDRAAPETFATKTEAAKWLTNKEAEINREEWINPESGQVKLRQFATDWVAERPKMRPTTRQRCATLVRLHIAPYLGDRALSDVKPADIRRWYKQLADENAGQATIARSYQLLKSIFNTAVKDEIIRRNPCQIEGAAVYLVPERPIFTMQEIYAVADAMPPRFRMLVLLATFASLRWGEISGLQRRHVDLEACTVKVASTVVELDSGELLADQATKSPAGLRTVTFPASLAPDLRAHLRDFVGVEDRAPVFTTQSGTVLRRSNFREVWRRALVHAGLLGYVDQLPSGAWCAMWEDASDTTHHLEFSTERSAVSHVARVAVGGMHFHDLRHTGSTLAAQTGATLKELMDRMGHSTTRAAMIYQHNAKGRDQVIASALDKLIEQEREAHAAQPDDQITDELGEDDEGAD